MTAYAYNVVCHIADPARAAAWVRWLTAGHMAAVVAAGAQSAMLIRRDNNDGETGLTYEIRYIFPSRAAYDDYCAHHAPALRAEGRALFPPAAGFTYHRTSGTVITAL